MATWFGRRAPTQGVGGARPAAPTGRIRAVGPWSSFVRALPPPAPLSKRGSGVALTAVNWTDRLQDWACALGNGVTASPKAL
jgi:hypothetical protein